MKFTKMTIAAALLVAVAFTSCKPKDADILSKVETALKADPKAAGTKAEVKDGVVTLSGEVADAECKASCEKVAGEVKGVKLPVVNNLSFTAPVVVAPPPASLTTSLDEATMQKVKDGLKDMKTLTLAGFSGKGAIINGELTKEAKIKLMQMLASSKVLLDPTSNITIK